MKFCHWQFSFIVLALFHKVANAAFDDFVIKSESDLQRFEGESDEIGLGDDSDMYDRCGYSGGVAHYEAGSDYEAFQLALQRGEIDMEALQMSLLKMTNDPHLRQLFENAGYSNLGNGIDGFSESCDSSDLVSEGLSGYYDMWD